MSKKKETITALSAGTEPGAVRIKRKESDSEEYRIIEAATRFGTKSVAMACISIIVTYADFKNLIAFLLSSVLISLIYFGMRNG